MAREAYRPCAKRAAILYFVLSDLGGIDNMYQFSLDSYITLFHLSINKSAENIRTDSVANRVRLWGRFEGKRERLSKRMRWPHASKCNK